MRTECAPHRPLAFGTLGAFLKPDKQFATTGSGINCGGICSHQTFSIEIKSTSGAIIATSIVSAQVFLSALNHWTYITTVFFFVKRFGTDLALSRGNC